MNLSVGVIKTLFAWCGIECGCSSSSISLWNSSCDTARDLKFIFTRKLKHLTSFFSDERLHKRHGTPAVRSQLHCGIKFGSDTGCKTLLADTISPNWPWKSLCSLSGCRAQGLLFCSCDDQYLYRLHQTLWLTRIRPFPKRHVNIALGKVIAWVKNATVTSIT